MDVIEDLAYPLVLVVLEAEFAERLLVEHDVCVLAGTAFGGVGTDHIRISYANSSENLTEALRRPGYARRAEPARHSRRTE